MEKSLLRKAFVSELPDEIVHRKKSPYPKTFDPAYGAVVRHRIRCLLDDKDAPLFHVVNRDAVESLFDSEPVWPWYGQLMRLPQTFAWLLQVDFWLRRYKLELNY